MSEPTKFFPTMKKAAAAARKRIADADAAVFKEAEERDVAARKVQPLTDTQAAVNVRNMRIGKSRKSKRRKSKRCKSKRRKSMSH